MCPNRCVARRNLHTIYEFDSFSIKVGGARLCLVYHSSSSGDKLFSNLRKRTVTFKYTYTRLRTNTRVQQAKAGLQGLHFEHNLV